VFIACYVTTRIVVVVKYFLLITILRARPRSCTFYIVYTFNTTMKLLNRKELLIFLLINYSSFSFLHIH